MTKVIGTVWSTNCKYHMICTESILHRVFFKLNNWAHTYLDDDDLTKKKPHKWTDLPQIVIFITMFWFWYFSERECWSNFTHSRYYWPS